MSLSTESYQPNQFEDTIYRFWEEGGFFKPDMSSKADPFCIIKPPPNVTGALHMGHALTDTIEDAIVRYKRMKGFNTAFLPGTDHAGIATQSVVERELAKENLTRHDLGREAFLKRVWEHKEQSQKMINKQMRKLGGSLDWSRYSFTLDPHVRKAVKKVFCQLYQEGLIYRGTRMIAWCPKDETALSDLEVEQIETKGHMWRIKYVYADDPKKSLSVETTRPETIFADTAVAVHPDDERYKALIGKNVIVPGVGREVPVIADDYVDPKFGSGALKVTPGHDFNDYDIGQRHKLEIIQVIDKKGNMTGPVGKYKGMTAREARKAFVEQLEEAGLLEETKDHLHYVGRSHRSGAVVEPMISTQWFVSVKSLAEPAIKAVENGDIKMIPENWIKTYYEWMYNIRDWCISRQLWWGHQVPAYHCQDCKHIMVCAEDPTNCGKCGSKNVQQETDVLDTWFSSALWPMVTLGWPEKTEEFERFYPNQLLETGFDIIFFWVARMIMFGLKFGKDVPFEEVLFHAMVRDDKGHKMSKTTGNVVDPLDLIHTHGADALRFTLSSMAQQGRDIKLSKERVDGYRNFMNKIWNARRFLDLNLSDPKVLSGSLDVDSLHPINQWMLGRMSELSEKMSQAIDKYHLSDASQMIYHFFWHEFCDWYVEFCKVLFKDPKRKEETLKVAFHVFRDALKLLHPLAPFVTEKLFQTLPNKDSKAIIVAEYPKAQVQVNESAQSIVTALQQVITMIRKIRSMSGIPPSKEVATYIAMSEHPLDLDLASPFVSALSKTSTVTFQQPPNPDQMLKGLFKGGVVYVDPEGNIDVQNELSRLHKELSFVEKGKVNVEKKLANQKFVQKAPKETVELEKQKLTELNEKHQVLKDIVSTLERL